MFRNGASRLALRPITASSSAARPAAGFQHTSAQLQWKTQYGSLASRRPQLAAQLKPTTSVILRRGITDKQKEAEARYAKEEIKPTPETVTASSSVHPIFGEINNQQKTQQDVDMMAGVKHDVDTIKETFDLTRVPREAYYMGLAGTIPYLATSITTVFCAWEINHATAGYGYLLNQANATQLLHFIEPLQIGYGASILSFLGAIHWGLEWAGFGGYQGYKRYAIGVVAPAVAWSTILMPIEGALITQFLGFVGLYYVDIRATRRGWTPAWYGIYRFVLTAIVGASIVLTLVGRGELPDHVPSSTSRAKVFKMGSAEALAEEEAARAQKKKNDAKKDSRKGEEKEDKKRDDAKSGDEGGDDSSKDDGGDDSKDDGGDDAKDDGGNDSKDDDGDDSKGDDGDKSKEDGGKEGGDEKKDKKE